MRVVPRRVSNPPNPWASSHVEWLERAPEVALEVFEERARTVIASNDSPDVPFRYSVNPYRGCQHACAYCYARPSHQYLGFGAGTDFDRKIVVKTNIAERLRVAFDKPSWRGEVIAFSGNTDCYQPLEASYSLTRACLELCRDYRNPVQIITKSKLVRRDAELLAELDRVAAARVTVSIPFVDDAMARAIEPYASSPTKRFETVRVLRNAGVPVTVSLGPVIPGLNDDQIPDILERAAEAGAQAAFMILIRLPKEVLPVFTSRVEEAFPLRAGKVLNTIRSVRGGATNDSTFGARMRGKGPRWKAIDQLFEMHRRRAGLEPSEPIAPLETFRRPSDQLSLFDTT